MISRTPISTVLILILDKCLGILAEALDDCTPTYLRLPFEVSTKKGLLSLQETRPEKAIY